MAKNSTNDFIRYSAYSIKDLITRKLSEDSQFTDQIYEGSNLAILIDIVSYMYQCLIYNMNTAAAESMFADTQLYENISRLCKFIGYHPAGFKPSTINLYITNESEQSSNDEEDQTDEKLSDQTIYPCTAVDTGLYDSNGKKIFFSTTFDSELNNGPIDITKGEFTNVMLVNGRWKHYGTVFTASGVDYETFVLTGIESNSSNEKYVSDNGIKVFVEKQDGGVDSDWYSDPNEIFIQAFDSNNSSNTTIFSKLYDNDDKVYSVYMNEYKTYEIKFGNGVIGRKLENGDRVHILYLDTNGPDGYVDLSEMKTNVVGTNIFTHNNNFFGLSKDLYDKMFNYGSDSSNIAEYNKRNELSVQFDVTSLTRPKVEQNVEAIRETAPNWFKTGNRLITKKDYEFFLKSNNANPMFNGIIDVKCMNNWDYLVTFYRWLYNMGLNPIPEALAYSLKTNPQFARQKDPYRYMSKVRLVQAGYEFVDSADANNIYLWIMMSKSNEGGLKELKSQLNASIQQIKTMTTETYPLKPISVYFVPSFTPIELFYEKMVQNSGDVSFDNTNSYIEVTVSDNIIYSTITLLNKIYDIIVDGFDEFHNRLGQTVDYSTMLDRIYEINGIEKVRTVYYPDDYLENEQNYEQYKARACDGLAFASWSSTDVIDIGDDLQINNTTRTLEDFQFPQIVPGTDIKKKIKIIKKSMNTTNPVKF